MHRAFWNISLPPPHDYGVKVPSFTFVEGKNRRQRLFFFFSWTSIQSSKFNSEKVADIWRTERRRHCCLRSQFFGAGAGTWSTISLRRLQSLIGQLSFLLVPNMVLAKMNIYERRRNWSPVHTYPDIFESGFFFFADYVSVHTYPVNPAYESVTFGIHSPEWKFLNTPQIGNRVDAKSGYFFIRRRNKNEPSSLPWILYSRKQPRSQVLSRQSKMQISHALRSMLYCQYFQRSPGY